MKQKTYKVNILKHGGVAQIRMGIKLRGLDVNLSRQPRLQEAKQWSEGILVTACSLIPHQIYHGTFLILLAVY